MAVNEIRSKYFRLPQTVEVIRSNIIKYGNPLALTGPEVASWAKGLDLPTQGDVLFYTGGEYQLIPFIDSLVQTMLKMDQGSRSFSVMMGLRNLMDKAGISAEKLYASVLAKDRERFSLIPYKAAAVLKELGLDFCYLGEEEIYSGALLYEFGFWNDLERHAEKVASLIKNTGAQTIVCLSPHAAEIFKLVYPKLVEGFEIEVKTFVEAVSELAENNAGGLPCGFSGKVVVHDACRMARELEITEEIREILARMNAVTVLEAEQNRRWTTCCGGPSKVLFPEISSQIACQRAHELEETGADLVLTFCPYCMASVDKGIRDTKKDIRLEDFIEFLYRGIA